MNEKKQEEDEVLVVRELPSQSIRKISNEEGKEFSLVTVEEALAEILKIAKKIERATV